MIIQDMLKLNRKKRGYTQEQVAKQLFVSTQAVSKWENGQSMPSIDNLLALSDMYNLSLDELIQGSPFFKKPYVIGKKYTWKKGMRFMIGWFFVVSLISGFYYQSLWLWGMFVVGVTFLPLMMSDYWMIEQEGLTLKQYPKGLKESYRAHWTYITRSIPYSEITAVEIIYQPKIRMSPMDLGPDTFGLRVHLTDEQVSLPFKTDTAKFLPQFIQFLSRKGIMVIDERRIVEGMLTGKPIYEWLESQI